MLDLMEDLANAQCRPNRCQSVYLIKTFTRGRALGSKNFIIMTDANPSSLFPPLSTRAQYLHLHNGVPNNGVPNKPAVRAIQRAISEQN